MDTQSYTPEIQRLIATSILLSNGGSIYLAPGTMSFPVIDEDKNVREKDVTAIFYGMGTSPKDICLYYHIDKKSVRCYKRLRSCDGRG